MSDLQSSFVSQPLIVNVQAKVLAMLVLSSLACLFFTKGIYLLPLLITITTSFFYMLLKTLRVAMVMQKLQYVWSIDDRERSQKNHQAPSKVKPSPQLPYYKFFLTITNPTPHVLHEFTLCIRSHEGLSHPVQITLHAHSVSKVYFQYTPSSLQDFMIWGLEVVGTDPYHLLQSHIHIPLHHHIDLYNQPWKLHRLNVSYFKTISEHLKRHQMSHLNEGEFQELRSYHSSDDRRQIAWKASIKRNQLLVKTYQPPLHIQSYLVLDISWIMRHYHFQQQRLDLAVQLARYLLHMNRTQGMGLILFDDQVLAHLPPKASLMHKDELLRYAYQVVHESSTEINQAQLWALLGDYLDWHGVKGVKSIHNHSPTSYAHTLLDQYQTRDILKYLRTQKHKSIPLGLTTPFSNKNVDQELRHYCWSYQITLPHRLVEGHSEQRQAIKKLMQHIQQKQVTHLSLLTHSQRFVQSKDLQPILQWCQKGGHVHWYQVGCHEYSYPTLLTPLRKHIQIYPIPFDEMNQISTSHFTQSSSYISSYQASSSLQWVDCPPS